MCQVQCSKLGTFVSGDLAAFPLQPLQRSVSGRSFKLPDATRHAYAILGLIGGGLDPQMETCTPCWYRRDIAKSRLLAQETDAKQLRCFWGRGW